MINVMMMLFEKIVFKMYRYLLFQKLTEQINK